MFQDYTHPHNTPSPLPHHHPGNVSSRISSCFVQGIHYFLTLITDDK